MSEENKQQIIEVLNNSLGTEISVESMSEISVEAEGFLLGNQERFINLMNCCEQYIKMKGMFDSVSPISFGYGFILGTVRERNKNEIKTFVSTFERLMVKK